MLCINFCKEINARLLNKFSASSHNSPCYKLAAVIVQTFKLNKPHYMVCVKPGSNWIKYDETKIKKISQKSVLNNVGTLVATEVASVSCILYIFRERNYDIHSSLEI